MQGNTILFVAVVTLLSLLNGVRAHRIFILKRRGGTWSFDCYCTSIFHYWHQNVSWNALNMCNSFHHFLLWKPLFHTFLGFFIMRFY
jgi:hypothetical protein